ncbi:MAG TPA: polyketide cyclase, partial [Alphaproteobacteria bacterium]|nr:polyketide cyclase [Alphaproteobacteria bacterium]
RIIADCHAINNQINDEWLIRDQGAIIRQLGWEAKTYAADLIEREG